MIRPPTFLYVAFVVLLLVASPALAQTQNQEQGLALWAKVHQVLSHPRCANCHVGSDNVPLWYEPHDQEALRAHGMDIHAGESRTGAETLPCATCHTAHNTALPHGAPGAPNWHLPPVVQQWSGKTSGEICSQIKDPARSKPSLDAVAEHIATDPLVAWGWAPGPGRAPAPYSASEVAQFVRQWAAAGAPCPSQ